MNFSSCAAPFGDFLSPKKLFFLYLYEPFCVFTEEHEGTLHNVPMFLSDTATVIPQNLKLSHGRTSGPRKGHQKGHQLEGTSKRTQKRRRPPQRRLWVIKT